MDLALREKRNLLAVNLGLGMNVCLAAAKTTIGVLAHSPALLADGINSTSDVAYLIVVRIFIRLAGQPADDEHPYGHTQLESIAALVVGSFILTTAVAVFWGAISTAYDLLCGQLASEGAGVTALYIALLTIVLKIWLTAFTQRIWKQTGSAAILALAMDHRNDIFSATAAAIGIFLGRAGHAWVDPAAGALVALIILRTGISVLRQSSSDLMDTLPGNALSERLYALTLDVPGVRGVESIQAHRFGPYFIVNLTISVEGAASVHEGHAIASAVEDRLLAQVEYLRRVYVHYQPA